MKIINKNIKSIKIHENSFFFEFGRNEKLIVELDELNKIFITFNSKRFFYYYVFAIFFIFILLFFLVLNFLSISIFCLILFLFFGCFFYFVNYRSYSIILKLNNTFIYRFYFSRTFRYDFLEKVKIIRGKLQENFFINNIDI